MFKMAKKSKLKTPEWILEGYDSEEEYNRAKGISPAKKNKGKTFKIRECPECRSRDVGVVLSGNDFEEESNTGKEWECRKCGWRGKNIVEKELAEEEFLKYTDSQAGKTEK